MKYGLTTRPFDIFDEFDRVMGLTPYKVSSGRSFSVDVEENENAYVLTAELPGVSEKNLDVSVDKNILKLSFKEQKEKEEKDKNFLIKERSEFISERRFKLPENASSDEIDAELKNGILTLTISKKAETKPKLISIKSA